MLNKYSYVNFKLSLHFFSSVIYDGHYLLVNGEFMISLTTLRSSIPYKYTVFTPKTRHSSQKDDVYERLYCDNTGISPVANRVLEVPSNITQKGKQFILKKLYSYFFFIIYSCASRL